jgi:ABC-type dipeptide/oligopeptide/nickel transport system permease component/outer membrane protein assembly factor BamB
LRLIAHRAFRMVPPRAVALILLLLLVVLGALLVPPIDTRSPSPGPARPGAAESSGIAPLTSSGPSSEWTTYQGSPARDGYSDVDPWSQGETSWFDCPTPFGFRSGPVGNVSVVFAANTNGTIYAFEPNSTALFLWRYPAGSVVGDLSFADPYLIYGDQGGGLRALWASNGSTAWAVQLGSPIAQTVEADNGTLYLVTQSGNVSARSVASGALLWSTPLATSVSGGISEENDTLYVVATDGRVFALSLTGTVLWRSAAEGSVITAPSIAGGLILLAGATGTVTALDATNGTLVWNATVLGTDRALAAVPVTPAVGDGLVVVRAESGALLALDESTGAVVWNDAIPEFAGTVVVSSPVVTPAAVFAVDPSNQAVYAYSPSNGSPIWAHTLLVPSYDSPALIGGTLYVGDEGGCLFGFASSAPLVTYPVSGVVLDREQAPIGGAFVLAGPGQNYTAADGSFELTLPNGTYSLSVNAPGYASLAQPLVINGTGILGLRLVLSPVTLYRVTGRVIDGFSQAGLVGLPVTVSGRSGLSSTVTTGANGSFQIDEPNGTYLVSVSPPGYAPTSVTVQVAGGAVVGAVVAIYPANYQYASNDPDHLVIVLPLVGAAIAGLSFRIRDQRERRRTRGLSPGILSPFGRYVLMRALLLPVQLTLVLTVVYAFNFVLVDQVLFAGQLGLVPAAQGYGTMWVDLFTGQWGTVSVLTFTAPTVQFFFWWLPPSLELGLVALLFAMLLAYPLGLLAGWSRSATLDGGVRVSSMVGAQIPSFLAALLVLIVIVPVFVNSLADLPFGLLPSPAWFALHGHQPNWLGPLDTTTPTGLPVVDGLLHRDWAFAAISFWKLILQALIISIVYLAIFLRQARAIVVQGSRRLYIHAARARGVPERDLLWRHVGRRVLPFLVLSFALTLPVFVGTMIVVEFLFSDQTIGYLIIGLLTSYPTAQVSLTTPSVLLVSIFLLAIIVLSALLGADILARYLDPQLQSTGGDERHA